MNQNDAYCYGPCNQCESFDRCYTEMGCVKGLILSVAEQQSLRRHSAADPPQPSVGATDVATSNPPAPPRAFEKAP